MSRKLDELLKNNREWAEQVRRDDPTFFKRLSSQQSPKYLWIGCSDSRVPANQIMGLAPGEVFVHRNIANVCQTTIVQDAWARGQTLSVHGWCYSLHDGRVNDLELGVSGADELLPAYDAALARIRTSKASA